MAGHTGIRMLSIGFVFSVFLSTAEGQSGFPVSVRDAFDRTVTVRTHPHRIVSLAPSHTEILFALGVGPEVVGVTIFSNYPPEARTRPVIGSYVMPNLEKIIALAPDLVVTGRDCGYEFVQRLEALGIIVHISNPKDLRELLITIDTIGRLTGHTAQAESLIASLNDQIQKMDIIGS